MLDPRFVAENPDTVVDHLRRRNADEDTLAVPARVASLQTERVALIQETEACRALRNDLSPKIGAMMKAGDREAAEELKTQVREASERAKALEARTTEIEAERTALLMSLPNLLDDRVPPGLHEGDNQEIRRWGEPGTPEFDFVAEPFWADNGTEFPVHEIVKVAVTRAAPVLSPAYTYIDGLTEDELREAYLAKYGVRPA